MKSITSTRRRFLAGASGLGLLGCLPKLALALQKLPRRGIPGTNETLPVIGLGSTKPVRQIGVSGAGRLESVIWMLMSYGGEVVDTAPREEAIDSKFGKLLQKPELREHLFIAGKVMATGRQAGVAQFRQTQRLFGRQTLDLVQIQSLVDLDTQWLNLRDWKQSGEARYIGVTVSDEDLYPTLEAFMRRERPDFVQVNYSVMETLADDRLLPLAADMGIGVLVNGPFMNGRYFGIVKGRKLPDWTREFDCESWAEFSLKYILANPTITCVLTETTNPKHMEENIGAAFGRLPDSAMRRRMRELAQNL